MDKSEPVYRTQTRSEVERVARYRDVAESLITATEELLIRREGTEPYKAAEEQARGAIEALRELSDD